MIDGKLLRPEGYDLLEQVAFDLCIRHAPEGITSIVVATYANVSRLEALGALERLTRKGRLECEAKNARLGIYTVRWPGLVGVER